VGKTFPTSCTELTERIAEASHAVLYSYNAYFMHRKWDRCSVTFGDEQIPENLLDLYKARVATEIKTALAALKPNSLRFKSAFINADLTLSTPYIRQGGEMTVEVTLSNNIIYDNSHRPVVMRWLLPEGFTASGPLSILLPRIDRHNVDAVRLTYTITATERVMPENRLVLEITSPGRATALYADFVLLGC
jgi:hypothetical protein